jgi:hypothetical protein
MVMIQMLQQAGVAALISLMVPVVPMVLGLVYAVRPTESRLALLRPLSLAAIFASLAGMSLGILNGLRHAAQNLLPLTAPPVLYGFAESLVSLFVGFGCLTVTWLSVAIGMRRQA